MLSGSKPERKVLVVDDDYDMAKAIQFVIEAYGNTVCDITHKPTEALAAMSKNHYDFIIMDQQLPGVEGADLLVLMDTYLDCNNITAAIISSEEILLKEGYKLNHLELQDLVDKSDLPRFLSTNFAS